MERLVKQGNLALGKTIFSIIKMKEGEHHNCNLPLIKRKCYFKK